MRAPFDSHVETLLQTNPSMSVPWFLMASYAYYELDDPLLTDSYYDELAVFMIANWDTIEHVHRHLIKLENLECGSGFDIEYPGMCKGGAELLLREGLHAKAVSVKPTVSVQPTLDDFFG